MHIAFLTSAHKAKDDRIYYHQARALSQNGDKVLIVSSKEKFVQQEDNIYFDSFEDLSISKREKINTFIEKLKPAKPDVVICSEPIAIVAAHRYRRKFHANVKIIYDVTEWYPSKKNLQHLSPMKRFVTFCKLLAFNLIASSKTDAFIFGEYYKSLPYRKIFPSKAFLFSTYYPDIKYITPLSPRLESNLLRLSYSGKLSREKGYENFLNVVLEIHKTRPSLRQKIKIVGWYADSKEEEYFERWINTLPPSVEIVKYDGQSFEKYIKLIADSDVFLDLRYDDWENQHCLPIKLFYFAALQRPIIYSRLKAIEKEVETDEVGYLFDPQEYKSIANAILQYLDNPELYYRSCQKARTIAENKYNWNRIKPDFVDFVLSLVD
jgi:glycosyltransferase involved in cell wall biosynthesis